MCELTVTQRRGVTSPRSIDRGMMAMVMMVIVVMVKVMAMTVVKVMIVGKVMVMRKPTVLAWMMVPKRTML